MAWASRSGRDLYSKDRPEEWRILASGPAYGKHSSRKENRHPPASRGRRNPVFAERNGSGAFGKHGERGPCGSQRVHSCRYVDLCRQSWKRRNQPGRPFFLAPLRGLHARDIGWGRRKKCSAVSGRGGGGGEKEV